MESVQGLSAALPPYEWINELIRRAGAGTPVSQDLFKSHFAARTWYPRNLFATMFDMFRKYKLYAVTYGLEVSPKIPTTLDLLTENSTLWVLNFLYNGTILGTSDNGYYQTNPIVFPDLKAAIDTTPGQPGDSLNQCASLTTRR
ncbi:MAG: hypothetical protein HY650_01705 [Acidobacteria bacterium]|nr:hypothetical protein [Acidobacteriota bacterium]